MNQILPACQPFIFESAVRSHGWYQLAPLHWEAEQQILRKPEQLANGRVVLLEIRSHPQGIAITVDESLAKNEEDELAQKVGWMFSLESDFNAFYEAADQEPRLSHCRANAYGRLLRSTTFFEDVVRVMMTTNIQWSGTKRLIAKLVDHFGTPLPQSPNLPISNLQSSNAFPTPHSIAACDEPTLRSLGLGYRSPYLLKLAQGVESGQIDLEAFKDQTQPTDSLRKEILKLPGIGPYAAATMLSILGRYDYIGVDSEAMSSVSKYFYGGQPVGEKEVYAVFGKWGKYKALAYWFWDFAGMQLSPIE